MQNPDDCLDERIHPLPQPPTTHKEGRVQPEPHSIRNTAWADEGGLQVSLRRSGTKVVVEITSEDQATTRATLAGYRWQRLLASLQPGPSPSRSAQRRVAAQKGEPVPEFDRPDPPMPGEFNCVDCGARFLDGPDFTCKVHGGVCSTCYYPHKHNQHRPEPAADIDLDYLANIGVPAADAPYAHCQEPGCDGEQWIGSLWCRKHWKPQVTMQPGPVADALDLGTLEIAVQQWEHDGSNLLYVMGAVKVLIAALREARKQAAESYTMLHSQIAGLFQANERLRQQRDEYKREWELACERERARWEAEKELRQQVVELADTIAQLRPAAERAVGAIEEATRLRLQVAELQRDLAGAHQVQNGLMADVLALSGQVAELQDHSTNSAGST